jgi:predicted dehydrogenase
MDGKVKIGIVGLGKMGLLHASLLNVMPSAAVVALCEKSALMGRIFRKVFSSTGVRVVDNVEKFVGLGLDAVYVTTPISSHLPVVKELFEKDIVHNVFVEKTLTMNYLKSRELCEIAQKTGGVNMVGYMKRFSVVFDKAKALLLHCDLGEPESFSAYAYSSDFLGLTKESKSSSSRGGALSDIGCHIIDLTLWLVGDLQPSEILSVAKNEAGSETSISFSAHSSSGLNGRFDISQEKPNYRMPEFGVSIQFPKGKIEVNDDRLCLTTKEGTKKFYRHDLNDTAYFSIGEAEYFRENECFLNSLLGKGKCEPSFDQASKVDLLIDQVRERSDFNEHQ